MQNEFRVRTADLPHRLRSFGFRVLEVWGFGFGGLGFRGHVQSFPRGRGQGFIFQA